MTGLVRRLDLITATSVHLNSELAYFDLTITYSSGAGLDQDADGILLAAADVSHLCLYCILIPDVQLEDALNTLPTQGDEAPSDLAVLSVVNYYLGRVDIVSLKLD
jgi:hypothetical protein